MPYTGGEDSREVVELLDVVADAFQRSSVLTLGGRKLVLFVSAHPGGLAGGAATGQLWHPPPPSENRGGGGCSSTTTSI